MPRYLEQANECTDPTTGDYLWVYDASAGATDKDRKVDITRFVTKANAGTITAQQTFTGGIISNPTSSSVAGINITPVTGTNVASVLINSADVGNSGGAIFLQIGRNTNATTAAGFIRIYGKTGNANDIWADSSATPGVLRIGNATGTGTDTGGSVVGSQTSWHEFKENIAPFSDHQQALDAVLDVDLFNYNLVNDETQRSYCGLVITEDDRGAWFSENDGAHQVPALNERNLFGYLIASIKAQQAQIEQLAAQVEALQNA